MKGKSNIRRIRDFVTEQKAKGVTMFEARDTGYDIIDKFNKVIAAHMNCFIECPEFLDFLIDIDERKSFIEAIGKHMDNSVFDRSLPEFEELKKARGKMIKKINPKQNE